LSETTHIKVKRITHETLKKIAQKHKIPIMEVVEYLVSLNEEYNFLNPEWKQYLLQSAMEEFKQKLEQEFEKRYERDKFNWKMKFKYLMVKEYINVLDEKERRNFIEEKLMDLSREDFLERITEMEIIVVNGRTRLVKLKNGIPQIGIKPEHLIRCEKGWHVKGKYCRCPIWSKCPIRVEEYLTAKERRRKKYYEERARSQYT